MEKISRQRRSESAWREIVERQGQSGLTVPSSANEKGLKAASLYGWRVAIAGGIAESARPPRCIRRSRSREDPSEEFIDLGSLGASRVAL